MAASDVRMEEVTPERAAELAQAMRQADRAEVQASGGYTTPLDAVVDSLSWSEERWAAYAGEELLGIWGVVLPAPEVAVPWFLSTGAVERHPRAFLRASRVVVADLLTRYGALEQRIDARYGQALRWVERLGFKVDEPAPFGVEGRPFCRISMRRDASV